MFFQLTLNKFIRTAADLLPRPLYVPYIKMMAGLANGPSSAHHVYSLLKVNALQGGQSQLTQPANLYFFTVVIRLREHIDDELEFLSEVP